MGFLAFHFWLVRRYPLIVVDAVEDVQQGSSSGADFNRPNPNGLEFDNLYVDMKWIIRPSFHPEGKPVPSTFEQVFQHIFDHIDRVFAIVRPKKLLYLAVDGVLPRSKMNLQRAKAYIAAKCNRKSLPEEDKLSKDFQSICQLSPGANAAHFLDENIIAPGTKFMENFTVAVKYYVRLRINHDPGWRNIKVIFSDASVPGEGQQKIMSYIRFQRNLPVYDANTRHCLFGLEADSLMLALATHEIHFSILHEAMTHHKFENETSSPTQQECILDVDMDTKSKESNILETGKFQLSTCERHYQFLHLWILREYLEDDLQISDAVQEIDFEHLIDDFVFMCFLAVGEFLPQLPVLEIQEGPMTLLMEIYKKEFRKMGGYLTESGEANLRRIEHFIQAIGTLENDSINKQAYFKVNFGELFWNERYYTENFGAFTSGAAHDIKREVVLKYTEGLCWILRYYYQGVCSWQWYYPYNFAPAASDMKDLEELEITFFLGKPIKPFEYLMGVLPLASSYILPEQYSRLMTNLDSPISEFYPKVTGVDIHGEKHISQLPFIDEARLLTETRKIEQTLKDFERQRNIEGSDLLFLSCFHPLSPHIFSLYAHNENAIDQNGVRRKEIDLVASGGMHGFVALCEEDPCPSAVTSPISWMSNISNNYVLCVLYQCPAYHRHVPKLVAGVVFPNKVVMKKEMKLNIPRIVVPNGFKDLDAGEQLQEPNGNKAATGETLSHNDQGNEARLSGTAFCEPLKLSPKSRAAGPPGFVHVAPTSVSSALSTNMNLSRTSTGFQSASLSMPSQIDCSSLNTLPQQHGQVASVLSHTSLPPNGTVSSRPIKASLENVIPSPPTLKSTVGPGASGFHGSSENLAQGYSIPTFVPSSSGSSMGQGNFNPTANTMPNYNATVATASLQGGRPIPQQSTFTNSSTLNAPMPEFHGVRPLYEYPQPPIPTQHNQIMRGLPLGQQGFPRFIPGGVQQAQHMPMRPLGLPHQPGPVPPQVPSHPWSSERGPGLSAPPFFPHSQHMGPAHYVMGDTRPGNFARGRAMGPRHPNAVFH